jgi:YadA-like membrane anchor domain
MNRYAYRVLAASLLGVGTFLGAMMPADAAPVEYVKVCGVDGPGSAYIPGTDKCTNLNDIARNADGAAIGLALQNTALPQGKTFGVGGGWGTFNGSNAVGVGGIYKVNDNLYLNGGVGVGADTHTVGGRAGFMFAW